MSESDQTLPKGEMPCRQAGKRGGDATKAKHGDAYYQAISAQGSRRLKELLDRGRAAEEQADERE